MDNEITTKRSSESNRTYYGESYTVLSVCSEVTRRMDSKSLFFYVWGKREE